MSAAALACPRYCRRITLHECDLALIEWDAGEPEEPCGRCPYNPLLDLVPEKPGGEVGHG